MENEATSRTQDSIAPVRSAPGIAPRPRRAGVALLAMTLMVGMGGALSACHRRSDRPLPGQPYPSSAASPKVSTFVFKEEGKLYMLSVGVNATRFHDADPFIPLAVVVANKTDTRMNLHRESFTLVDPITGSRYGLASIEEARRQGKQVHDRRLMDMEHLMLHLETYTEIPSNFFPGASLLNDQIELHGFNYMADTLYFPRPEGQLLGKRFELHVTAKDLKAPLFVVFDVPEK